MCYDDFDFDGYDGMDDPDDDFQEDIFDEEFEPELDEFDAQEENDEPFAPESENSESAFGFREVFILGGKFGQAYEEALDEKEQRNKKGNDDGDDSI
jgi:hypothetical protein